MRHASIGILALAALLAAGGGCKHAPGNGTADTGSPPPTDGGSAEPDPPIISPNAEGWWRDDVFYEIFVRSFQDSDANGVGDLLGIAGRLDYLNDAKPETEADLGIDALWLMPIMPSPSYHGYDVTNYREIDPDYGTLADFEALLEAAHARGIKVIIDLVLNHTSSEHPWFISAKRGTDAPYRDYYVWRDEKPTGADWKRPWDGAEVWHEINGAWYYALFWGGMPDLNWRNPEVEREMLEVMRFWLARGVDGFRIDAALYLVESEDGKLAGQPETHEVIQRMRHAIHQEYPEALFVAEAWTNANDIAAFYGEGNEYQLAFSFDIAGAIKESVDDGVRTALNQGNYVADGVFTDRGFEAPFLANHDMERVMRELTQATDPGPAWAEARLALAALMAHPGTPFLYYGEEIGMVGGPLRRDEDKRTPMHWTPGGPHFGFTSAATTWYGGGAPEAEGVDVETQQADPGSLWNLYRRLIALRRASPALADGAATRPKIEGGGRGAFAMLRSAGSGERVLFVTNLWSEDSGAFTVAVEGVPTLLEAEGLESPPVLQDGLLSFAGLPPRSFAFIRID